MEIHQVRYFLAVCKTLNFTRAAEQCNVSQPALSRAIRRLEEELGSELFRRERTLTHLTNFGQVVLPALRQCYESSVQARGLAQSYLKEGYVLLNLGLSRMIDLDLLAPMLAEITTAFPQIEIKLFRGSPDLIYDKLKNGDIELAVCGPLDDSWERIDTWMLFVQRFGLFSAKHHPLAQKNAIELRDLSGAKLLCLPQCSISERLFEALEISGIHGISKHEVSSLDDMTGLVRSNFGIGISPLNRSLSEGLCLHEILDMDLSRWIGVSAVAGRRYSIGAATLIRLLRAKNWQCPTPAQAPLAELKS